MAVRMKDIARHLGVSVAGPQSVLALSRYSTSQIPTSYQPAFAPGNVRSALNPLTGAYLPAAYIGLFVPGTGNPSNGGGLSGDSTDHRGFVNQAPILPGPRLGFAYDVFGDGKTAFRAGVGMLYVCPARHVRPGQCRKVQCPQSGRQQLGHGAFQAVQREE